MARSRPRLTSIGALGLGAGWEWVSTDAEIVRRLVVFLEDRRALAYDHHREDVGYVVESVLRIREKLTEALQQLAAESGANRPVPALRHARLVFLDLTVHGPLAPILRAADGDDEAADEAADEERG